MSVIVCQRGARHRYAVPRLLEEAGLLSALYTDSNADSVLGRAARLLPFRTKGVARLLSRKIEGVSPQRVLSSDRPVFQQIVGRKVNFADDCLRWGTRGAKVVYSMFGSEWRFLKQAKSEGLKIVMDVFIHPNAEAIIRDEMEAHPWSRGPVPTFVGQAPWLRTLFEFSDVILCPCRAVADGVLQLSPDCQHKIRILPYGSSFPTDLAPRKRKERSILFAGSDGLRKGLHHLAESAAIVGREFPDVEFRVAGLETGQIPDQMPHKSELTFLGRLPLDMMREEYLTATAFALPSLAEGQAGVVLEALALGAPVVATPEAGVDFEDGVTGRLVRTGDPDELARVILELLDDPAAREQLGAAGQRWAAEHFSMDAWGRRLEAMVREVEADSASSG